MHLPNNLVELQELLSKLPQQKMAKLISAILLCYIAYVAAQITWLFVEPKQITSVTPIIVNTSSPQISQRIDLSSIRKLNLFGEYNAQVKKQQPVKPIQDAPETKLNLILSGVVASDDSTTAAAIIEKSGKQETYGIGDNIVGTRATLESVFNDRVLIKVSGRLETLMLDGFKYQKPKSNSPVNVNRGNNLNLMQLDSPKVIDQRDNESLQQSAGQLQEELANDPAKITDYLRVTPKTQDGTVIGYQLMPGKNGEFFKSSGLKAGDIAIQINGYDLTVPSNALQAMQELKEQQEVSLLVDRQGEITEILFSILQ